MPHAVDATSLRSLLAYREFVKFWVARVLSVLANQMLLVAVGWQMYDLTGQAWDLGLVGLFQFVPALLLTLPAGEVADRCHRARVIAASLALQVVIGAVLAMASHGEWATRELLLAISILLGVARAFQMPAQQSITPLLVPNERLAQAITISTAGMEIAVIVGPALGGVLYLGGAALVYGVSAGLLAIGTVLALGIQYAFQRPTHIDSHPWGRLLEGLRYVGRNKVLLGAISLDLFAVLLGGAVALLPIYAKDILQVGPEGLGVLRAAPSLGALVMTLWLIYRPLERRVGPVLLMAVAVFGLATVVFGLSRSMWLSVAALALAGAADSISVVIRLTVMQLETPDALRGRVSAVNSIFIGASNQLGEFESGGLAALVGPVPAVVLGGIGTILVALGWVWLFPSLARRDHLTPPTRPSK